MPATSRAPPPGLPRASLCPVAPPTRALGLVPASARLTPNLTRQQPFPHALQTRDREEYELGGCPRPNVVLVSVHFGPRAAAGATAKKEDELSRDKPSRRAALSYSALGNR